MKSGYILGNEKKELQRLQLQSKAFKSETLRTLELAGIKRGMNCVDIGCGLGDVTFLMAKLVGEQGSVVGVDTSKEVIEICKRRAARERIKNVRFLVDNVYKSKLKSNSFDFVFSRFVFQHLPYPKKAIVVMKDLLRKGGIVAAEENDHGMWLSYPPSTGFEELRQMYVDLLRLSNGDDLIARKLYGLFLKAGLRSNVGAYSICIPMRKPFNMLAILVAEVLKPKIIETGLMSNERFEQMMRKLKEYARKKDGLALYALTFRVWGKNNDS